MSGSPHLDAKASTLTHSDPPPDSAHSNSATSVASNNDMAMSVDSQSTTRGELVNGSDAVTYSSNQIPDIGTSSNGIAVAVGTGTDSTTMNKKPSKHSSSYARFPLAGSLAHASKEVEKLLKLLENSQRRADHYERLTRGFQMASTTTDDQRAMQQYIAQLEQRVMDAEIARDDALAKMVAIRDRSRSFLDAQTHFLDVRRDLERAMEAEIPVPVSASGLRLSTPASARDVNVEAEGSISRPLSASVLNPSLSPISARPVSSSPAMQEMRQAYAPLPSRVRPREDIEGFDRDRDDNERAGNKRQRASSFASSYSTPLYPNRDELRRMPVGSSNSNLTWVTPGEREGDELSRSYKDSWRDRDEGGSSRHEEQHPSRDEYIYTPRQSTSHQRPRETRERPSLPPLPVPPQSRLASHMQHPTSSPPSSSGSGGNNASASSSTRGSFRLIDASPARDSPTFAVHTFSLNVPPPLSDSVAQPPPASSQASTPGSKHFNRHDERKGDATPRSGYQFNHNTDGRR